MKSFRILRQGALGALALLALGASATNEEPPKDEILSLTGTWTLDSAYEILRSDERVTNYGEHPRGLLMIDAAGRYSLQIFRPDRPRFATGDKTRGEPEEYRQAVLGASTHFGRVRLDAAHHQLLFEVEAASFPNWEGKQQVREYTYENGLLTYAVPASAAGNGTIAYSCWRKAAEP